MLEWLNKKPSEVFVATYLFKLAWGWCSNVRLQLCTRPPRGPAALVWVGALPHTPSDVQPAPLLPLRHHSTELYSAWKQQEMGISLVDPCRISAAGNGDQLHEVWWVSVS